MHLVYLHELPERLKDAVLVNFSIQSSTIPAFYPHRVLVAPLIVASVVLFTFYFLWNERYMCNVRYMLSFYHVLSCPFFAHAAKRKKFCLL